MAPETEQGFGSGLRRQIERKQNPDELVAEQVVEAPVDEFYEPIFDDAPRAKAEPAPEPPPAPVVEEAPDLGPELDALRAELQEVRERERTSHDELEGATRAVTDRERDVERWAHDLQERETALKQRVAELEREQAALVERHTEI